MFHLDQALKVYLHHEPIDCRQNISGLALLVDKAVGLDPFATCVYVFSNRRRNRVKILGWDRNGSWLLLKRLEQDHFIWPTADAVSTLTVEQLHWLLEGIDIGVVQRHPQRFYDTDPEGLDALLPLVSDRIARAGEQEVVRANRRRAPL